MNKLGLYIWKINISIMRIDGSKPEIFSMIIVSFVIDDKNKISGFFEKIFSLADRSIHITLKILFLIWSNLGINFMNKRLKKKLFIIAKAFFITKQVKLIWVIKFKASAIDLDYKIFFLYIAFIIIIHLYLKVYLSRRVQITFCKANQAPIFVFAKCADITDIISKDLAARFPEHIGIYDHIIDLVED